MNEPRQVQLNVGFRDESCYVGVSATFTGKGEDKELVVSCTNVLLGIV